MWANGKVQHTSALSGAANTPGTTYLLTGSDSRADGSVGDDGTEGARTDTILLLQVPEHGPTALISLPRDTYVKIPGHDAAKLNAAFSWGQAPLLVKTVEGLTGDGFPGGALLGLALGFFSLAAGGGFPAQILLRLTETLFRGLAASFRLCPAVRFAGQPFLGFLGPGDELVH